MFLRHSQFFKVAALYENGTKLFVYFCTTTSNFDLTTPTDVLYCVMCYVVHVIYIP
jgi:hypothetical protein